MIEKITSKGDIFLPKGYRQFIATGSLCPAQNIFSRTFFLWGELPFTIVLGNSLILWNIFLSKSSIKKKVKNYLFSASNQTSEPKVIRSEIDVWTYKTIRDFLFKIPSLPIFNPLGQMRVIFLLYSKFFIKLFHLKRLSYTLLWE